MKLEDVILRGDRASQPMANTVPIGTLYFVTDEGLTERSDGSSWESYSGGGGNTTAEYLTGQDETGDLPNSRNLIAGTGISFDDTTPGERTINAAGGGGALSVVEATLNNTEILDLAASPYELLPAPGSGMMYFPIALFMTSNFSAGAYTDLDIQLDAAGTVFFPTWPNLSGDRVYGEMLTIGTVFGNKSLFNNVPLTLSSLTSPGGGNAANELKVVLIYRTITLLA